MSKLAEAERAIGQAETAIAALHTTLGALVEAEARIARARRGLMRPRNLLLAGALTLGLVAMVVTVRRIRARRSYARELAGTPGEADYRVAS